MNLIIVSEQDRQGEKTFKLSGDRFWHIKNVLKAKNGDFISVGILNDLWGYAKIHEMDEKSALVSILEFFEPHKNEPAIDIICALPRPQTLKKVLSTCATMGVNHLYLIRSEKVEKSYFQSPLLKEENYTRFLLEGLSQGKRTLLPGVTIHDRFKPFFDNFPLNGNKECLKLLAQPVNFSRLGDFSINNYNKLIFAIGPEGGWNEFEIKYMIEKGFAEYSLGRSILRVENAVTAAIAQLDLLSDSFL